LPLWGLILFALLSYHAIRVNHEMRQGSPGRYFWWGSIRLDSDPLNKHPRAPLSCEHGIEDCVNWDPEYIWVTPGLMEKALVLSALPAFAASLAVVHGLARLGISQVLSFMSSTPVFIFAWFYFAGWLLDRWRYKRSLYVAATRR
jgi:hypothetical protein